MAIVDQRRRYFFFCVEVFIYQMGETGFYKLVQWWFSNLLYFESKQRLLILQARKFVNLLLGTRWGSARQVKFVLIPRVWHLVLFSSFEYSEQTGV